MAYPITTAGILNGTILSFHDIVKPDIAKTLYRAYQMPSNTFKNLLTMWGSVRPVTDSVFHYYEKGWTWQTVSVRTNVADPGVGNPASVTLSVADHSNGRIFPTVGETILLPQAKGFIEVRIMDITTTNPAAQVLTIIPVSATDNIGALTAGTTLVIYSSAYGGGTGQPDGKQTFPIKRTFYLQIQKETLSMVGDIITKPTWYTFDEINGVTNGLWAEELTETQMRLEMKESNSYWMGQEATNPALVTGANEAALYGGDGINSYIYKTKGFYRWASELGYTLPVALGAESLNDFGDIVDYQKSQGVGATVNLVMIGQQRMNAYDAEVLDVLDQTGVSDWVRGLVKNTPGGKEGMSAYFDFARLKKSGSEFVFCMMDEFDNPKMLNATGYNMSQYAVVSPLSTFENTKTKTVLPTMMVNYLANHGYSRQMETWTVGGAGGGYTYNTEIDKKEWFMRSHTGFSGAHFNQVVIIEP